MQNTKCEGERWTEAGCQGNQLSHAILSQPWAREPSFQLPTKGVTRLQLGTRLPDKEHGSFNAGTGSNFQCNFQLHF